MINTSLTVLGKTISNISQKLNRGNGSTWPGHIALKGNKNFIRDILSHSKTKIIIVAGTNGKTTTSRLIKTGLEKSGRTVIQNASGANLLNGVASTLLLNTNAKGQLTQDFAIFEVDENALPLVLNQITPDYLILLNLFRDQLDRYGELNSIAQKWQQAMSKLPEKTKFIINADDPQIASIPVFLKIQQQQLLYFGLQNNDKQAYHAADSVTCPRCAAQLSFESNTYSHLGKWKCPTCGLARPKPSLTTYPVYPLTGAYNKYNTIAAALLMKDNGITEEQITNAFENFTPAFGRQEIVNYLGKNVQLFLSKNPTSFNQSFATIKELNGKTILLVLNDRIPDGRDISWIWDTSLTGLEDFNHIFLTGDRVYDLALRLKYELGITNYGKRVTTFESLKDAISSSVNNLALNDTLYILPTYSAMLETRKILTGKKIL